MKNQLFNIFLVVVGFILSPLSWWNDLLVNIPLSYLLSWPFSVIDERLFLPAFILAYWLSNLLGLLLMHWGGQRILHNNVYRFSIKNSLLVSVAYTLIILIFALQGWLVSPATLLDYLN